jgi:hypothetical protein
MKPGPLFIFPLLLLVYFMPSKMIDNQPDNNPLMQDGPYVLYKNGQVFIKYIREANGIRQVQTDSMSVQRRRDINLRVNTDITGVTFNVPLKEQLQNEKPEHPLNGKLLVISDIEGNFAGFRKLLQGNGVINENFDWTFGNSQLVLVGDFCDRGPQVTEVFWLIYSLEEKAKAAGGYVHFVLGNHELMNLSGDIDYIHRKYLETEVLLNEKYQSLFNENSELGRWLRTKNIVEKVGDILFAHAGISPQINRLNLSINNINDIARPFYADTTYNYPDKRLESIYSDYGPFWYRGYYRGTLRATTAQVDSTLDKFGNRHIVTGHTIIADKITVWYGGKVINTDVHHAQGQSEALLIEDKKFYRVDPLGNRVLLFE